MPSSPHTLLLSERPGKEAAGNGERFGLTFTTSLVVMMIPMLKFNRRSAGFLLAPIVLTALAAGAWAQGRATPGASTEAPAAQGGRGRGGVAGPGPSVEPGFVDETPVVTKHSINVGGKKIDYTATVAQMPLKNSSGDTEAHIFYMAYTQDGVSDLSKRPLTFCFNGGPGSASMWVHMGGMGPRSPKLMPDGSCRRRRIS